MTDDLSYSRLRSTALLEVPVKILVIDDSPEDIAAVRSGFTTQWREANVISRERGRDALDAIESEWPGLVVLDAWLPDVEDGYGILSEIRSFSDVPVLVLSCRPDVAENVRALDLGADDYIGKPFDRLELVARARARSSITSTPSRISSSPTPRRRI
jgi:two-component system KDP operon response regulator KdpE